MLWSTPRSRSTAFLRMMIERGDFTAINEPFTYVTRFGLADIGGKRLTTAREVIAELRRLASAGPVFAKETTNQSYPEVLSDQRFLGEDAHHAFLIRHPRETISSYLAIREDAPLHEMGFESLYNVYTEISALNGRDPLIIDADDLMSRPADIISAYCAHAGIDFRPQALNWRPSDRVEWQPSKIWHTDVAASSGIGITQGRPRPDPGKQPLFGAYLDYHLPFYQMLYRRRLRPESEMARTASGR
jgi:hypothetical protein